MSNVEANIEVNDNSIVAINALYNNIQSGKNLFLIKANTGSNQNI